MKKLLLFTAAILFLASCNDDDSDSNSIKLSFTNLPELGSDYVYEGWLMTGLEVTSAGRFTVDANGNLSQGSFSYPASTVNGADAYILTIEPANETGSALTTPSDVHILAGNFSGNSATVTIGDQRAIGSNFSTAVGKYILATPTTSVTTDEESGVWFLVPPGSPGLTLPTLPDGWIYEGWGVFNGTPYSTGTFRSVSGMDGAALYSGTDAVGPPFPGEDFVQNNSAFPSSLLGGAVVISVEPYPDNDPAPFIIKPLIGHVASNAIAHTVYNMDVNQNDQPTGTITR